jgi:seryl-tRNA synthetase
MEDACRRGGDVATAVAAWKRLDERRKELQSRLDKAREERNKANERMAKLDKKSPEFASARDSASSTSTRGRGSRGRGSRCCAAARRG